MRRRESARHASGRWSRPARGVGRSGRFGPLAVAAIAIVLSGCQGDSNAGGPVLVEVNAPDRIEAVDVGDANAPEPFGATSPAAPLPDVTYEFATDLALPANDYGYVYRASSSVDPAAIDRVAKFFGLDPAEVQNWDDFAQAQPDQSDSAQAPGAGLGYSPNEALQQWTYADYQLSNPYRNCQPAQAPTAEPAAPKPDGTGVDLDVGGDTPDRCIPPEPDGTPPTGVEAEAKLAGMLDTIGVTHGPLTFQTYADEFTASTNAVELDETGLRTGREWSASYGAGGVVISAMGPFAVPERVGPYDLVDIETAKGRVAAGVNSFGPMGTASGAGDPTLDNPDISTSSTGPTSPAGSTGSTGSTVVRIVAVDADLYWVWDAENTAWLVPAYAFRDTDGGIWSVPAVPDDLFAAS